MINILPIQAELTLPLRHIVLWPNKPVAFCQLDEDHLAQHFGAFDGEELVSVASIFATDQGVQLCKFATHPDWQGRGIGRQMVCHIMAVLETQAVDYLWCDARASAQGFYQKLGLTPIGEAFLKYGEPYQKYGRSLVASV